MTTRKNRRWMEEEVLFVFETHCETKGQWDAEDVHFLQRMLAHFRLHDDAPVTRSTPSIRARLRHFRRLEEGEETGVPELDREIWNMYRTENKRREAIRALYNTHLWKS